MQTRFLYALVRHSKTTLLQDAIKWQTVLIRRSIFLLLNQVFYILNHIKGRKEIKKAVLEEHIQVPFESFSFRQIKRTKKDRCLIFGNYGIRKKNSTLQ